MNIPSLEKRHAEIVTKYSSQASVNSLKSTVLAAEPDLIYPPKQLTQTISWLEWEASVQSKVPK